MQTSNKKAFPLWRNVLAFSISSPLAASVFAQGVATEKSLEPVIVTATRSPLAPNLPTSTFSIMREALNAQSYLNSEDALNYAPNTTVRKRFIGDRPKLSLAHMLNNEWLVRGSLARGVRFPTVSELFQGARSGTAIIINDPNMRIRPFLHPRARTGRVCCAYVLRSLAVIAPARGWVRSAFAMRQQPEN